MNRAMNGDGLGLHLAFDLGVLAKCQNSLGDDFPIQLAVKNQFIVKFQRPDDFPVVGKDVLRG